MELRDFVRLLHKNWILIAATIAVGIAAGVGATYAMTPKYQSTAQLYVSTISGESAAAVDLVQGSTFARQSVVSYIDVVTSSMVLDRVADRLGLEATADELAQQLTASSPEDTVLIEITATGTSAEDTAELANTAAEVFADVVTDEIEIVDSEGESRVQIRTIDPATPPADPISPQLTLNIAVGALAGLLLGLGIAMVRFMADTRIRSLADVKRVVDAPVIGASPHDPNAKKRPLVMQSEPSSPRAEAVRKLRTNVEFLDLDSDRRIFVISSAVAGEGKSTTAANLAIALAEAGLSVALVDADLRKPKIAEYMGIEGAVGLTDVLIGKVELTDALQPWGKGRLAVLPSGRIPPNPSELLGSRAMQEVLATLGANLDYVIVDAPPLLLVTDAAVVARFASGMIFAVAAGSTKRQALEGAVEAVRAGGSRLLGVVVTNLPTKGPDSYSYGGYSYASAYGSYGGYEAPTAASHRQQPSKQQPTRQQSAQQQPTRQQSAQQQAAPEAARAAESFRS